MLHFLDYMFLDFVNEVARKLEKWTVECTEGCENSFPPSVQQYCSTKRLPDVRKQLWHRDDVPNKIFKRTIESHLILEVSNIRISPLPV